MVSTSSNSTDYKCDNGKLTTCSINCTGQASHKRRNTSHDDQNDVEALSNKRGCAMKDHFVACPLAKYGCDSRVLYDDLLDHYSSGLHQTTLMKEIERYVRELHSKPYDDITEANVDPTEHSELLEAVNALAEGVSCLNDDNARLSVDFTQLQHTIKEQQKHIVQLQQSMEETCQIHNAAQTNTQILQTEIESVRQTVVDGSSLASHDGSYIWKITNVTEHIANAAMEKQTSIYSPAFYSSPTGYKFCMRLYPHGDGNARRTHLSLFLVVMRGNFDPILSWPFQHKVTFCLYDQTVAQRHIIDSFRPDLKSTSFQQPRSNMNIASGLTKFAPLPMIQQENSSYVRDDCMFIRCFIDFESLPKLCIPYQISLNPALPLHLQQRMIQAETEKQRKAAAAADSSVKVEDLNDRR